MSYKEDTQKELNKNIEQIMKEIQKKTDYSKPFYAEPTRIETDMDSFPYPRYFRGDPNQTNPVVFEREAGWRAVPPIIKSPVQSGLIPHLCFEAPCSTIYPCYSIDAIGGMRNNCVNLPP